MLCFILSSYLLLHLHNFYWLSRGCVSSADRVGVTVTSSNRSRISKSISFISNVLIQEITKYTTATTPTNPFALTLLPFTLFATCQFYISDSAQQSSIFSCHSEKIFLVCALLFLFLSFQRINGFPCVFLCIRYPSAPNTTIMPTTPSSVTAWSYKKQDNKVLKRMRNDIIILNTTAPKFLTV